MGLFPKKSTDVNVLAGKGFTVTKVLLDPPRMSLLPAIYLDEPARRWAVRFPGAQPAVFDFADVLEAHVVEVEDGSSASQSDRERAWQIISNPARVSRANAARKGFSFGVGVVVAVETAGKGRSYLQIPVFMGERKRTSSSFQKVAGVAQALADEFASMAGAPRTSKL